MLLVERVFARFTVLLCDMLNLTQSDIDRCKARERGTAPPAYRVAHQRQAAGRAQLVIRFRD